ncbi:hypothetical protein [Rhodococcus sp. NPDC003348]
MTRATKQSPAPAPVELEDEFDTHAPVLTTSGTDSTDPGMALRLAKASALGVLKGAGGLVKGGGTVSAYLLGLGYSMAKSALSRPRHAAAAPLTDENVVAAAVAPDHRGGRFRRIAVVGALGVAVAAGVAVWRLRRAEPAPVADQPPSLRDLEAVEQ